MSLRAMRSSCGGMETMLVKISNELIIRCSPKHFNVIYPHLQKFLKFESPEYKTRRRQRLYISKELMSNRYFYAYGVEEIPGGDYVVKAPRGYWQKLRPFLKSKYIKCKVRKEMLDRPLKNKLKYETDVDLRPYQIAAVEAAVSAENGVIVAPCGSGKTQILTEIARRLNVWTLIIVNTDDLMQQMKERLEKSFNTKVGIIKQDEMNIRPLTVASVQTLHRRGIPDKVKNKFGCVMLDESHHMPAESFTEVMMQFPARYRFGTTATPKREDKLHGLMYAVIGYKIFEVDYQTLYDGNYLMPAYVQPIYTDFAQPMGSRKGYGKILDKLIRDEDRNELIVRSLWRTRNKYNLILSRRIEHLETLHAKLIEDHPELENRASLLIGNMKRKDRDEVLRDMRFCRINYIFATQLADEGLDMPVLDDLHMVFPGRAEGKVQQQVGRIQRTYPDKKKPVVHDYVDIEQPTFYRQSLERQRVYKRTGCIVLDGQGKRQETVARPRRFIPR